MAYNGATQYSGRSGSPFPGNGARKNPTTSIKKSVSYVAGSADSNLVISISGTDAADAIKSSIPSAVEVKNTGVVPTIVISQYEGYSDEDTDAGRVILFTFASDTINADYSINAVCSYHIR